MVVSKRDSGMEELDVLQLSDGERTLVALVGDIARRLAIADPYARRNTGCGVVLIDEVELHLHPGWQRRLVRDLPNVFPNVQFFFTTHSPIVAGSAPPCGLFLLDGGRVQRRRAYGQGVDSILEELFSTAPRDERVRADLDNLLDVINDGNADEARAKMAILEERVGVDDPELVRARTRMRGKGLA